MLRIINDLSVHISGFCIVLFYTYLYFFPFQKKYILHLLTDVFSNKNNQYALSLSFFLPICRFITVGTLVSFCGTKN